MGEAKIFEFHCEINALHSASALKPQIQVKGIANGYPGKSSPSILSILSYFLYFPYFPHFPYSPLRTNSPGNIHK